MAIFANIETEAKIQVGDKTRLDARKSFTNQGETFDLVEIAQDGITFVDVTADLYLDTVYTSGRTNRPIVRVTSGVLVETTTGSIQSISATSDNLFSSDAQLQEHEDDVLNFIREGRDSFLDKHRLAQSIILNDLDKNQIWLDNGNRYTSFDIVDIQEFTEWSKFITLRLIFETNSNEIGDIFHDKANRYRSMEIEASKRAILRLDTNGDGEESKINIYSGSLTRG